MSQIIITVNRRWQTEQSTISEFHTTAADTGISCQRVHGYILEEKGPSTVQRNQDRRIPAGIYTLKWHNSPRFGKKLPLLYNNLVPASRYILIHSGNHAGHTEGCLLVGNSRSENSIGGSRLKLNELLQFLSCFDLSTGNYALEIKESF